MKQDKQEIDNICEKYGIENYTINEDGSIDVDGDVFLRWAKLKKLPLKFGKVTGDFWCNDNKLTNLYGAPYYVGKNFDCSCNKLTNLVGSPQEIGDSFYCNENELTTLKGAPLKVNGEFCCNDNKLIDLRYLPKYIGSGINCSNNNLITLKGICEKVNGVLLCHDNKIKNIDYLPITYPNLCITNNPIYDILTHIIKFDDGWYIEGKYLIKKEDKYLISEFNDREIIQTDILIIDRLVEFLKDIGKPRTKKYLINKLNKEYEI